MWQLAWPACALPPEARLALLARGVNITNWFRFPPSADPARLDAYLSDAAMARLRDAGFTFVRLPVQPDLAATASLPRAITRLRRAGLAVVVALAPRGWSLEGAAADRARLRAAWAGLAPTLRRIDPAAIFPEFVNEPVFAANPGDWAPLQVELLTALRREWPEATAILTGPLWGGIDGLLALAPVPDANVVYSFHFYEPAVLTALGAFEPALDHVALAALPFPAAVNCPVWSTDRRTRAVAAWYCAGGFDAAWLAARIGLAAGWGRRHNAAILAGEIGATASLNAPARLGWFEATRRALAAHRIGWALWGYDDIMGFNLPRPPPAIPVLDPGLLRALGLATSAEPRL